MTQRQRLDSLLQSIATQAVQAQAASGSGLQELMNDLMDDAERAMLLASAVNQEAEAQS